MLFAAYVFVTAVPATVVLATYVYSDRTRLAARLATRMHLDSATADLVRGVLGGAATHRFVSTLLALASVIVFGSGFGRTLQLIHARVWGVDVSASRLRDNERYFAVLVALVALITLYLLETTLDAGALSSPVIFAPLWGLAFIAYFVWAPHLLLHGKVRVADLLPGAVVIAVATLGLRLMAPIVLSRWLQGYSGNFGGFGIVLALFFWLLLFGSVVVAGAALAPPLASRRALLAGRGDAGPVRKP
jgi:uncharacterized BrkB/YihY/UPF0761 family membrane protein